MALVAQNTTLLSSAARTATGQGTAVAGLSRFSSVTLMLDVTADESTAADTLDVLVQRLLPDGSSYDTIARFQQHVGNNGADKYVADVSNGVDDNATRDADDDVTTLANVTLASQATRDVGWGDQLRVAWIVTDDSGSASFTFAVTADFRP